MLSINKAGKIGSRTSLPNTRKHLQLTGVLPRLALLCKLNPIGNKHRGGLDERQLKPGAKREKLNDREGKDRWGGVGRASMYNKHRGLGAKVVAKLKRWPGLHR